MAVMLHDLEGNRGSGKR